MRFAHAQVEEYGRAQGVHHLREERHSWKNSPGGPRHAKDLGEHTRHFLALTNAKRMNKKVLNVHSHLRTMSGEGFKR